MQVHHVALRTTDLGQLAGFYENVLGLRRVYERDGAIWFSLGAAMLMLELRAEGEPAVPNGCMELLALQADQPACASLRRLLAEFGVPIEAETQHTLYFRDPDGRRLGVSSYAFDTSAMG